MLYSFIPVTSPKDVYRLFCDDEMKLLDREMLCVVCTNSMGQEINMAYSFGVFGVEEKDRTAQCAAQSLS